MAGTTDPVAPMLSIGGISFYTEWTLSHFGDVTLASLGDLPLAQFGFVQEIEEYDLAHFGDVTLLSLGDEVLEDLGYSGMWIPNPLMMTDGDEPSVEHQIEARSVCDFKFYDPDGLYNWEYGQEVILFDSTTGHRYFCGLITTAVLKTIPGNTNRIHSLSCADYHLLAEWRLFYGAYPSETAGNVVAAILVILAEEGVTEGEIQTGPTLTDLKIPLDTCAVALNKVAELAGFIWFINEDKELYFVARDTYDATWDISDTTRLISDSVEIESGNPEYRNVQVIQGSRAKLTARTENFKGDGQQKTFPVGFDIVEEPTITLDGTPQTVGVGNEDVEAGKDWYWSTGTNTITQRNAVAAIAIGQILAVTYVGSYNLMVKASLTPEITRQRTAAGFGTGKVERISVDNTLITQAAALATAKARLEQYAVSAMTLRYRTRYNGLATGTLQHVTLAALDVDDDLLITNISMKFEQFISWYDVEAVFGPRDESWQEFFCGMAEDARRSAAETIGESDTIQGLEQFTHDWLATDHPNPFIEVFPDCLPSDVDFPCLDEDDRLTYLVIYEDGSEVYRSAILSQVQGATEITTTALLLAGDCNNVVLSHIALFGGSGCSATPGSGIELSKHVYVHTKNALEALQFDFTDSKGW